MNGTHVRRRQDEGSPADVRIGVVSLLPPNLAGDDSRGEVNKREYAARHRYGFHCHGLDPQHPFAWSKIRALESHLNDYDWLWWCDTDAVVTNPNIRLESLVDARYDVVVPEDEDGLNTRSFLISTTPWSHKLLKELSEQTRLISTPDWERSAFRFLFETDVFVRSHVKVVRQRATRADGILRPRAQHGVEYPIQFSRPEIEEGSRMVSDWLRRDQQPLPVANPERLVFGADGHVLGTESEEANAVFERLSARRPDSASAQLFLGRSEFQEGRFEAAADHLRRVVALDPTNASASALLAHALERIRLARQAGE